MVSKKSKKSSRHCTQAGGLAHEFIARAVHRPEMDWMGWIFLQLLPQLQNMIVDGASGRIALVSPNLVEELLAGDYPILVLNEESQNLELLGGQWNRFSCLSQFHLGKIYRDVVESKNLGRRGQPRGAPDGSLNSRQQLSG